MRRSARWIGWALCLCASLTASAQDDGALVDLTRGDGTESDTGAESAAEFLRCNKVKERKCQYRSYTSKYTNTSCNRSTPALPCCAPGGVAHARSVPGHAAPWNARVSRAEGRQETEGQSRQERLPAGDPADVLGSSARLSGQDEQRRPLPGQCFACQLNF